MAIIPTLDFFVVNIVKNMVLNVIGCNTTKCGCSSLIPIH
jgi:hypothetical protein